MEYGVALENFAKTAALNIVILGDEGELGKTQREKELPMMDRKGYKYEKMTFAQYKTRFGSKDDEIARLRAELERLRTSDHAGYGAPPAPEAQQNNTVKESWAFAKQKMTHV